MSKQTEEKIKALDEITSNKLLKLSRKYPQMCLEYLTELHKVLDWAEKQLDKINK